jgi:hypothetical protein
MKTIAIAVLLASAFAVAQDNPHPTVYRLEYTITEMEGTKKLSSRTYTLQAEDGKSAAMRVGTRIPVATGSPSLTEGAVSYNYMDVGVNLDVTASVMDATNLRLKTNIEISSVIAPATPAGGTRQPPPATRQTRDSSTTVIPLDKLVTLTTQDDPSYNTTTQVQVIAKVVK